MHGKTRFSLALGLLGLTILAATHTFAQQVKVLQRARLGNQTEDITFVTNGPRADYVAIVDGFQVGGVHSGKRPRSLFDLHALGIRVAPRGITYMASEELFSITDGLEVNTLFLADSRGRPEGTRPIQYLNGFVPDFLEGLAYIPENSAHFPDHLILAANSFSLNQAFLEIMERNGVVVDQIAIDPSITTYITGVAFHAPDRILVSSGNLIWDLDFNGNVIVGPITIDNVSDIEGLVQISNGDIAAADYQAGELFFFDQNLNRLQNLDRSYKIGINVSVPAGVTWNTDTNQYLVAHAAGLPQTPEIVSIPPSLNKATQVVNLAADGYGGRQDLAYLPDKHLIAATVGASQQIVFFNNGGVQVGQIDVSAFGIPNNIDYIPTKKQFAVTFQSAPLVIDILDTKGNFVRSIDLSSTPLDGISCFAFFNPSDPSGGQFLVLGGSNANLALLTDFLGNVQGEFNYRAALGSINPVDVTAITTGAQKGAFSLMDVGNAEMVVFNVQ